MDVVDALTFEKVWTMFQETDRKIKETSEQMKETDRIVKENSLQMKETDERMKETDRRMQETDRRMQETDRRMKETDKKIGELTNRFGELAEHLVAPSIMEKFNELNFTFEHISQNHKISDASGNLITQIDIILENGDTVMVVEIKAKPNQKDVDEHINRMEILRGRADARNDKRKYRGAIAGAIMNADVRNYAHKSGFYVIEQTGDTVKITVPIGFTAREW